MSRKPHTKRAGGRKDKLVTPFFDSSRCPICAATLPARPLSCPACGVALTGPTVTELVSALRRADSLADRMRAQMQSSAQSRSLSQHGSDAQAQPDPQPSTGPRRPDSQPARSWFAGRSVGVILLVLGALCVLAAAAVFIAVAWIVLPLVLRTLILVVVTASFGFLAHLALRRGLQATAESLAVITAGMIILDLAAARRAGLLGLADLGTATYEILAGVLLAAVAVAGVSAVRRRQGWLWSLDAAVAFGMARAVLGALRIDSERYAVASVMLTVVTSLLFVLWRRLRLPVAKWSAVVLGAMAWLTAVAVGSERAADHVGTDVERLTQAWPALAVALVAGLWSVQLTHAGWRKGATFASLAPGLLVLEIVGWSHGWVVGSLVMLAGYAALALASRRVSAAWSPAVGTAALVLGVTSLVGLLPTLMALATRMGVPLEVLPAQGVLTGDVAPWLLPLTAAVVPGMLPLAVIEPYRLSVDRRHTAGVVVATLGVLPLLYGAGFWVAMSALVMVAAILLCGARLWRQDVLLVLGLIVLVIMRIYAFRDDLADPLAWTLVAPAFLALAMTDHRSAARAAFQTAAGLAALAGIAQWMSLVEVPGPLQGLVLVACGSLGLLASQSPSARAPKAWPRTRLVCEGLSVTWVLAGLAVAESSPTHGAAELTVAGVATGITAYLSPDRRPAGWVSGVLLTAASWIRLADSDIQVVEWYTVPAAAALLVYGTQRLRQDPGGSAESSLRCLGPGLSLALLPSLVLAMSEPVSWRGLLVSLASVSLVVLGMQARLVAPFALGAVGTGLLAVQNVGPVAAFVPRWTLLFLVGGVLLATGMTWESRVNDLRTAGRYVRGLR